MKNKLFSINPIKGLLLSIMNVPIARILLFLLPPSEISQFKGLTGSFTLQLTKVKKDSIEEKKLSSIQLTKVDIVTAGTKVGKFVNVISAPRASNAPCSALL